jgi:hypothetical protein
MQALWTWMQALLAGLGLVVLAMLGSPTDAWFAVATGATTLIIAVIANAVYTHALAGRPRSEQRWIGDRRRAMAMLVAFTAPTVYAEAATRNSHLRPFSDVLTGNSIAAFVACLVVVALSLLYLSSTIDWYVVRGWRDGIVVEPPCLRNGNRTTWLLITRIWLLHRIIATIGFFVGLWTLTGLGWFELLQHPGRSEWVTYLLGLASPSAIPLFFMRSYIASLGHAIGMAFGNLSISLGDHVSWKARDGAHRTGIVYDVSIDRGYRVIDKEGASRYLALADTRSDSVSVDEGGPEPWACRAVRKSELDGAADYWSDRRHPSGRVLIF